MIHTSLARTISVPCASAAPQSHRTRRHKAGRPASAHDLATFWEWWASDAARFLPHLQDRREAHIANVASMGAFLPVPGQTVYGASKAGVLLFTQGLYAELLDTSVGVSVVMPGGVATDITTNSGVDSPMSPEAAESSRMPVTTPEDAARRIVDGIEKDELYVHVGKDSIAMHLLQRVAPKQATHLITRQMAQLLG